MAFMQDGASNGLSQTQPMPFSEFKHSADCLRAISAHCGSLRNRCGKGSTLHDREEILFQPNPAGLGFCKQATLHFRFEMQSNGHRWASVEDDFTPPINRLQGNPVQPAFALGLESDYP
jgi:hypothetical protein